MHEERVGNLMDGKITLITPPDIFENDSYSILFMHLSDEDQDIVSKWFKESSIKDNINVYFYNAIDQLDWLFYAIARCDYKFIDLNNLNSETGLLAGYILSKKNTYYKLESALDNKIYNYINQGRISNIQSFLESAFNDQFRL